MHIDLPITEVGLGGVELGMSGSCVVSVLGEPLRVDRNIDVELWVYEGIDVLVFNGYVEKLYAREGYRGCTISGVRVGMSVAEFLLKFGEVWFDQEERVWKALKVRGIGFEIVRRDVNEEILGYGLNLEGSGQWGRRLTDEHDGFIGGIVVFEDVGGS